MTVVEQTRVVDLVVGIQTDLTNAVGHLCLAGQKLREIKENKLWRHYKTFGAFCKANFPNINISTINGLINQHKMYEVTISTKPEIAERIAMMSQQAAAKIPVKATKEQIVDISKVATKDGTVTPTKKMVNEAIKTVVNPELNSNLNSKDISLNETETKKVIDPKSKLKQGTNKTKQDTNIAEMPKMFSSIDVEKMIAYVEKVHDLAYVISTLAKRQAEYSASWDKYSKQAAQKDRALNVALRYMKLHLKSTPEVVKSTYKAMARQMHPDLGGSDDGMAKLNESMEVIKQWQQRSKKK